MSRRIVPLSVLLLGLIAPPSQAQIPFTRDMVPARTTLARLNLERAWLGVVPLGATYERVVLVSLAAYPRDLGDGRKTLDVMLFAQTNQANFHAFDATTGRHLWSVNLGRPTNVAHEPSINSDRVIVTNSQYLHCLDRGTGRNVWSVVLDALPSSPTACDEERAIVGLRNGKMVAYSIRDHSRDVPPGYSAATFLWAWKTAGMLTGRPVAAENVVAFASQDTRVYVALIDQATLVFRYLTGGPVSASLGTFGTRTLLVPSEDHNLYAIDLFNGETRWTYPSGAPIEQEPLLAGQDIYVANSVGQLTSVDPETGVARWELSTGQASLLAASPTRLYLHTADRDLMVVDRSKGTMVFDAAATLDRAGLKLRDFTLTPTNRFTDMLYFGTPSGLIVSLREPGRDGPTFVRDPNEPVFGHISDEDEAATPPESPPADTAPDFGGGFDPTGP